MAIGVQPCLAQRLDVPSIRRIPHLVLREEFFLKGDTAGEVPDAR
jgi:hypothetical protein